MNSITEREEILFWSKTARDILSNPRKKLTYHVSMELITYQILSYPKFNKLEIKMKTESMDDFIVVTMDMEQESPSN